jgi:hypothetical protein
METTCYRPNISRHVDATTIVMEDARPRATLLLSIFLALWLVAWGVGEYQVGHALFLASPDKGLPHPNGNTDTWRWFAGWSASSTSSVLEELRNYLAANHLTHVATADILPTPNS